MEATGWESIPKGQKIMVMMLDSIFDVPEAWNNQKLSLRAILGSIFFENFRYFLEIK